MTEGGSPERTTITTTTAVNPSSFFVPPYPPGNESFGDVFIVFDVLSVNGATNTVTISGNQAKQQDFYYGRSFELRNSTVAAFNDIYSTQATIPGVNQFGILIAGSPITQLGSPVSVVTNPPTNLGEVVLVPDGFDSEEFCGSPQIFQGYQYFIIETDTAANIFTVNGDATGDIQVSSPTGTFTIKVENAITPGVPITLNQNNGAYSVLSIVYDQNTNTTDIEVSPQILDPYPTGYIIPV